VKTYIVAFQNYSSDEPPAQPYVHIKGTAEVEAEDVYAAVQKVHAVLDPLHRLVSVTEAQQHGTA